MGAEGSLAAYIHLPLYVLHYRGVNHPPLPHPPLLFEVKTRIFWGKGDPESLLLCQAVSITCLLWAEPIRGRSSGLLSQHAAANPLLPQHMSLGKQHTAQLFSQPKAAARPPPHVMAFANRLQLQLEGVAMFGLRD